MASRRVLWKLRYAYGRRWASSWRRRALVLTHRHIDLEVAKGVAFGPRVDFWMPSDATLHIGPGCEFRRDFFCEIAPGGRVEMASGVVFTSAALLQISTSLTIGSRAVF